METEHSPEAEPARTRLAAAYGVDAPYVPILLGLGGLLLVGLGLFSRGMFGVFAAVFGAVLLGEAALFMSTTLWGKVRVWSEILDDLELTGDETILDLGCGRGMVLVAVAARLPSGKAMGIDLWRSKDQSGNEPEVARANAAREGVGDRVDLCTGDMRTLPFGAGSFDGVLSNAAIHNIPSRAGREAAVREAYRVTRPGGHLVLADIRHTRDYVATLRDCGAREVRRRSAGWRGWFGGPWVGTTVVRATR